MPILWQDDVVSYANVKALKKQLTIENSYERKPKKRTIFQILVRARRQQAFMTYVFRLTKTEQSVHQDHFFSF